MLVSQTIGLVEREDTVPNTRWFWESPTPCAGAAEEITLIADLARLREDLAAEFDRADVVRPHTPTPRW